MSAVYRNLGEKANFARPPRLLDRMRQVLHTKRDEETRSSQGRREGGNVGGISTGVVRRGRTALTKNWSTSYHVC